MQQPTAHSHRRPAAPDSSPRPSPPPHHRRLPDVQWLPLPSALVPPKKRRVLHPPPEATIPPPAPPAPAAETRVIPTPSTLPPVADSGILTPPPPTVVEDAEPSARPVPVADAKPFTPPPAPDAAAKPRKVRKVIRKVIVKKIVPKGTFAARKAAAEAAAAAAGASKSGGETLTNKPANDHKVATDESVGKEQDGNETVVGKPATECNVVAAPAVSAGASKSGAEIPTDKPTNDQDAATDESVDKEQDVNETVVEKLATDCSAVAVREALGEETVPESLPEETLSGMLATDCDAPVEEGVGMSERQRTRMKEVFVGGLHRDAKEEDVRAVFGKAGEITQLRLIMDAHTRKNKGYCFVQYREAAQAKKAISKFGNVKICGKFCRTVAPDENDIISLGNIDKKWKKEDIIKLLEKLEVENVHAVTVMADSSNPGCNRGFALVELKTSRDARMAYKKLSRKDVFGKGLNIWVAWAENGTLNDPDEKDMHKVKSIFVEGIPSSWDQAKLTDIFKNYGKIEHVFLSRNMQLAKKKDVACIKYMTHEAADLCLESFCKEELTENGSKVNIKISLAKPVQKGKQKKEDHNKSSISENGKTVAKSETLQTAGDKKSSTNHDSLHVPREQATWRHGHIGSAERIQDHPHTYSGEKRPSSTLDNYSFDRMRSHSRPRHGSSTYTSAIPSYCVLPPAITRYSLSSCHDTSRCPEGLASYYGVTISSISNQIRQAGAHQPEQPYGSRHYQKY